MFKIYVDNEHKIYKILFFKIKIKTKSETETQISMDATNQVIYDGKSLIPNAIQLFLDEFKNISVEIEKSEELENFCGCIDIIISGNNASLKIGKNLKIRGKLKIELGTDSCVTIGDNCLIADDVSILATDYHKIFDNQNNKLLNPVKPIKIGNNCWIARHVRILKGVSILNNSVIGISSLVNKSFNKENILIAGNPAKIVKENIYWKDC